MTPSTDDGISRVMQFIGRHYVQPFNRRYARTGTLFEGRFRSSLVQNNNYLLNCIRYIELNPVRAGITSDPGDYHWSSYRCHAFAQTEEIWSPHSDYLRLGSSPVDRAKAYQSIIGEVLTIETISKIRHCLNTGLVLGTEAFRDQVATLRQ
jgi:putative transposase